MIWKIRIDAGGIIWIYVTGSGSPIIYLIRKVDILRETLNYDEAVAEVDADIWANTQKRYLAKKTPSEVYLTEKRSYFSAWLHSLKSREKWLF